VIGFWWISTGQDKKTFFSLIFSMFVPYYLITGNGITVLRGMRHKIGGEQ